MLKILVIANLFFQKFFEVNKTVVERIERVAITVVFNNREMTVNEVGDIVDFYSRVKAYCIRELGVIEEIFQFGYRHTAKL